MRSIPECDQMRFLGGWRSGHEFGSDRMYGESIGLDRVNGIDHNFVG